MIPSAFILNWLYARNNRSIIACFLFHMITDVSAEMFAAQQPAKCIETGILILVSIWLVYKDREVFMPKDARARPAIYDDANAGAGAD